MDSRLASMQSAVKASDGRILKTQRARIVAVMASTRVPSAISKNENKLGLFC